MSDLDLSTYINERTRDFIGREWVFAAVQSWLADPHKKYFYLTGGPGSGKSAIAARLVQMSRGEANADAWPALGKGALSHFHFCRAASEDALNPLAFVRRLSLSLSRLEEFARALIEVNDPAITIKSEVNADTVNAGATVSGVTIRELAIGRMPARSAFDQLVRQPLQAIYASGFDQPLFILVDSLDEALTYGPEDNIAVLLADFLDDPADLPESVRFLFTSRSDPRLSNLFGAGDLDLIASAPADVDDVRVYAAARLRGLDEPHRIGLAERISAASAGSFLYARYVLDDLLARPELPADLEALDFPPGLNEIYRGFIRRELGRKVETWGERYRPILELLAVARDPGLDRDHLAAATGLPESSVDQILAAAAQYLQGAAPQGPFSLYHQSFREYLLTNPDFPVYPQEANRALGELFLDTYGEAWASCPDAYAVRNTPGHLQAAAAALTSPLKRAQQRRLFERLVDLLGNLDYLYVRLTQDGNSSAPLESEIGAVSNLLPSNGEQVYLRTIGDALQQESHILRADPGAFYVHLYNRLFRGDGGRIDQSLHASSLAPRGPWLRALHPLPVDSALVRTLSGHTETASGLAAFSHGRRLVSASSDKTFRIWNLDTGDELAAWPAPFEVQAEDEENDLSGYLEQVLADSDGRWFILRNLSDQVRLWDVGKKQASDLNLSGVIDMDLVPDNAGLILALADGSVELFHLESRQVVRRWALPGGEALVVAVSPQGGKLAAGGRDGQLWVWDLDWGGLGPDISGKFSSIEFTGQSLSTSRAGLDSKSEDPSYEDFSITTLAFSEDGRHLAVGDNAGGLYVWNVETLAQIWARSADRSMLRAVAVSVEAGYVLSGGVDSRLQVWELLTGELKAELRGHTGQIMDLVVLAGGKLAVTAGGAGTIRIWSLDKARFERDKFRHTATVNSVCLSLDGKFALTGGDDGRLLYWDVDQGVVLEQREIEARSITVAAFGQQDSYLAGDASGSIHRWQLGQEQPIVRIDPDFSEDVEEMKVEALVDLPEAVHAVSISFYEQQSVIWKNSGNGKPQVILHINGDYNAGAISGDASQVLLAYDMVSIWHANQPQTLVSFPENPDAVQRILFAAGGRQAAAGDLHGAIVVWDLKNGEARWLGDHTNYVKALALSPDGRWLVSGGWDKVLRLWDLASRQVVARYVWELPIESCDLCVTGNSLRLVVGDKQGNILFFDVNHLTG
jgi:WD40 repeat protein